MIITRELLKALMINSLKLIRASRFKYFNRPEFRTLLSLNLYVSCLGFNSSRETISLRVFYFKCQKIKDYCFGCQGSLGRRGMNVFLRDVVRGVPSENNCIIYKKLFILVRKFFIHN